MACAVCPIGHFRQAAMLCFRELFLCRVWSRQACAAITIILHAQEIASLATCRILLPGTSHTLTTHSLGLRQQPIFYLIKEQHAAHKGCLQRQFLQLNDEQVYLPADWPPGSKPSAVKKPASQAEVGVGMQLGVKAVQHSVARQIRHARLGQGVCTCCAHRLQHVRALHGRAGSRDQQNANAVLWVAYMRFCNLQKSFQRQQQPTECWARARTS